MAAPQLRLEDAENPKCDVMIDADPQTAVVPGPKPGTATVITPDGRRVQVIGDHQDVHARVQAAAARAHESGEAPQKNSGVS